MRFKGVLIAAVVVAGLSACGFTWYRVVAHPKPVACEYCLRALHRNLSVTAEIAGRRAEVCCPRCAITEANQQRKPLRLVAVHDYTTGAAITPAGAWYVDGSRAIACNHDAMHMNEMQETQDLTFDRCSPGTFTFKNRSDAEAFVAHNGGTVLSYGELMQEAHFQ